MVVENVYATAAIRKIRRERREPLAKLMVAWNLEFRSQNVA